jgi:E1-E2 ATPase
VHFKRLLAWTGSFALFTAGGAVVAASAGAVCGACFGAVLALVRSDPSVILPTLVHFTCCVSAAGATLGAFIRVMDGHNPLATREPGAPSADRLSSRGLCWRFCGPLCLDSAAGGNEWPSLNPGPCPTGAGDLLIRTCGVATLVVGSAAHARPLVDSLATLQSRVSDVVVLEAGQLIPADGEVVDGVALIDEGALTGESPYVVRHAGEAASAVVAGTRVVTGRIRVRITSMPASPSTTSMT